MDMQELKEFLKKHPSPTVKTATTIKSGSYVCIGPVRTLFGAEVMCSSDMYDKVMSYIANSQ